jgi:integrase
MHDIKVHVVEYGRKCLYMRYTDPITGKQKARSTGVPRTRKPKADMTAAVKVAAKWEHDLREGRYKDSTKIGWAEFRQRFEDEKLQGLSDNYAAVMNAAMNHFEELGINRLSQVDANVISRFQAQLREDGVRESTIRCYLKHIRAALSWACEIELIPAVPKITLPKRARTTRRMRGRPISGEEFDRMLDQVPKVVGAVSAVSWQRYLRGLWDSGLRLRESLTLSWDQDADVSVDLNGQRPRIRFYAEGQKRHRDELVPVTPEFAELLLATPESDRTGPVFELCGRNGSILAADAVGRIVSKIGKVAGVVVDKSEGKFATAHDLRRSFATRWSKLVKPITLRSIMRHADIKTTLAYYVDQDADEIAEELWREHEESGHLGNTLGNTPDVIAQQDSPPDAVTS